MNDWPQSIAYSKSISWGYFTLNHKIDGGFISPHFIWCVFRKLLKDLAILNLKTNCGGWGEKSTFSHIWPQVLALITPAELQNGQPKLGVSSISLLYPHLCSSFLFFLIAYLLLSRAQEFISFLICLQEKKKVDIISP